MISMYSPREQAADRRNHSPEAEAYRAARGFTCDPVSHERTAPIANFTSGWGYDRDRADYCD